MFFPQFRLNLQHDLISQTHRPEELVLQGVSDGSRLRCNLLLGLVRAEVSAARQQANLINRAIEINLRPC